MPRPDTRPTSERILQALTGFVVGAVLVYAAGLARRGFLDALLILAVGIAFALMRTTRLRWLATGFFAAGLLGLAALLAIVIVGHGFFD